jgi:hypothetical protein
MERVKIFHSGSSVERMEKLEERMNQWMEENREIEIVSRQVSSAVGAGSGEGGVLVSVYLVVIFYRPAPKK